MTTINKLADDLDRNVSIVGKPAGADINKTASTNAAAGNDDGDDDDDDDDADFADAKEEQSTFVPLKLDKKDIKLMLAESEKTFDQDLTDVVEAIHLFLNSRVKDSEKFLKAKYCKTLMHTIGYGVILSLKCLMTFDRYDIDAAMDALRVSVEVAQAFRKEQSLVGSLAGFVFGGGRGGKDGSSFKAMTKMQRHAEVVFAEAYLLRAVLSLLTDTNMVAFVREGLNIRQAYSIFKSGFRFLKRCWEEGGPQGLVDNKIDANFINAVYHGVGVFNLILSIMPARMLRIFEMIGFGGHRDFGMRCLELGAGWADAVDALAAASVSNSAGAGGGGDRIGASLNVSPTTAAAAAAAAAANTRRKKKTKKAIDFVFPDGTKAVAGIRSFLCDLSLHLYHIVLGSMIQMPGCNIPLARQMLNADLERHPNSFLYLTLHARVLQSSADPESAITQLTRVIDIQRDWRQLAHVCIWDIGMCHAALGRWLEASECFATLHAENTWSPAIYLYLRAAFLIMHDPQGKKKEIDEMLKEVPKKCKKVAGKSIPLEKFVARKSRKYFLQGDRLLMPGLEIIYMWNGFDHIPHDRLKVIQADVDAAIKSLDKQQEEFKKQPRARQPSSSSSSAAKTDTADAPYPTFFDDVCLLRFFKGLVLRELAYPTHMTLLPEETLVATASTVLTDKMAKDLQYAAKQFEYIALQADQIDLDHWMLPFTRYEQAQLYVRMAKYDLAKREYLAALNGGYAEDEAGHQRRKASMENSLHLRVHNGLVKLKGMEALAEGGRKSMSGSPTSATTVGSTDAEGDDDDSD
ncbi:hypothetical protein BC831DRAFT_485416 [Entophlyctis helioformis]|nr:hypothetical protein BC831DRAFT_485416 [Entophlyctis helioformis]